MTDTTTHEAALRELTAAVRELTAALAARPTYTINVNGASATRADIQAAITEADEHATAEDR